MGGGCAVVFFFKEKALGTIMHLKITMRMSEVGLGICTREKICFKIQSAEGISKWSINFV